jgi:hypothetical protein
MKIIICLLLAQLCFSFIMGYTTLPLVDFCTCQADGCAFFPFLCQSYVAVLKQLSFNFKNYVFFSCNPWILKGCCLFSFFGAEFRLAAWDLAQPLVCRNLTDTLYWKIVTPSHLYTIHLMSCCDSQGTPFPLLCVM